MKKTVLLLWVGLISILGVNVQASTQNTRHLCSTSNTKESVEVKETVQYKGKAISLGCNLETLKQILGNSDLELSDGTYDMIFYTKDANEIIIFYLKENQVVGFCSNAKSISFNEIECGKVADVSKPKLITIMDEFDNNKIAAIAYNIDASDTKCEQYLKANEQVVIALTNGFRAKNNIEPLKYSEKLEKIARNHSEDMASHNYFSHTNLQGLSSSTRIEKGGIDWKMCGENIAAGNSLGIEVFGQWLNSKGHRENMLGQKGYIGVGAMYNNSSDYKYYYTQNFADIK